MSANYSILTIDAGANAEITSALFPGGRMAPCALLSHEDVLRFDHTQLRIVLQQNARYVLPTTELIEFLRGEMLSLTIEVGAGHGDLGWHLGIVMTDSYVQCHDASVRMFYQATHCPFTIPPKEAVAKMTGEQAVVNYKPKCVIGAYITQRFDPERCEGFAEGIDEKFIIDNADKYIHIGNAGIHGSKGILSFLHREIYPPWMVTRAGDQSKNAIYIWEK